MAQSMHTMMNIDSTMAPPPPPASSLHPLLLLDEFLESLETNIGANHDNNNNDATTRVDADTEHITALEKRRDYILRVADFLYGGSMLEAALAVLETQGAIRAVTAHPSGRKAFLVRGAASRQAQDYFCLLSQEIQYCSCRSYFERAKNDPHGLCKHTLAIKLMPSLACPCRKEIVPDADFSGYVLRRLLPRELE